MAKSKLESRNPADSGKISPGSRVFTICGSCDDTRRAVTVW